MNKIQMNGYKRISKQYARTLWHSNPAVTIALAPCKQVPGHPMGTTIHASDEARTGETAITFDYFVSNFAWYNCGPGRDVGMYPAFYIYEGK